MNEFREKLFEVEHLLNNEARGESDVAFHIIWDAAAVLLDGVYRESHSDIIGSLMTRLAGSNSGVHHVYYLGDYEKNTDEYNQLCASFSSNARQAWADKERKDYLSNWLYQYEGFVYKYRLGTNRESIGDCWNKLIENEETERIAELIKGLELLHDDIIPVFKSELKSIIKEHFSEEVKDENQLDEAYKVVRKLQNDMVKFLKKERTKICAEEFCYIARHVSEGRVRINSLDFPSRWTREEFRELNRALDFAARAHKGDTRKGTDIPYIIHPIEAAIVTMGISDELEVSMAALLHDVVEDTDYKIEDIAHEFGSSVAQLVGYESEDKMRDMAAADSWKIRKVAFLNHLAEAPVQAKIICLGDKVSNMRQSVKTHKEKGDDMWLVFNQKDKKEQEWYYRSIYENMPELDDTDAYKEYVSMCNKVFK